MQPLLFYSSFISTPQEKKKTALFYNKITKIIGIFRFLYLKVAHIQMLVISLNFLRATLDFRARLMDKRAAAVPPRFR